jgi:L-ascorbate metabolism protein UlaG (beta-lactamase superfamily)
MEITWLGHSCFRIKSKEATIVTDPYDDSIGYKLGKVNADILTVSHRHRDHNYVNVVTGEPKIVDGPGEYEIKGVLITGVQTSHDDGNGKRGRNTVYLIETEDVIVCHLGDLGHVPTAEQVEHMSNVDVLMIPVGGTDTINSVQAAEVVSMIDPKIVIPMHYKTEALKLEIDPVDKFLREMGVKSPQVQQKLSITRSTLPAESQVVLMELRKP